MTYEENYGRSTFMLLPQMSIYEPLSFEAIGLLQTLQYMEYIGEPLTMASLQKVCYEDARCICRILEELEDMGLVKEV